MSEADDLALLPPDIADAATIDANGEVGWPREMAVRAVEELANAGRVILGLDLRDYDADGRFVEIAWSDYEPTGTDDVERGRVRALASLARPDALGSFVLITWQAPG